MHNILPDSIWEIFDLEEDKALLLEDVFLFFIEFAEI